MHTYLEKVHEELRSWDNGIDQCQQHDAPLPQHSCNDIFLNVNENTCKIYFSG